jgi:hypothetical protein
MSAASPLSYVYDGKQCVGHIIARGKLGHEAFDREERSLGMYETAAKAANALLDAAEAERSAG